MIRIFRLRGSERLSEAPTRQPDLAAATLAEVREAVAALALTNVEASAMDRALRDVVGPGADVLIAPGGSLYRVFPTHAATASKTAPRSSSSAASLPTWAADEREARVLAVDTTRSIEAFADLLVFLGYRARAAVLDGPAALASELERDDPLAVVLGPTLAATLDAPLLAACRSAPRTVVVMKPAKGDAAGADAAIDLPVVSSTVAGILDGAIRKAKRARDL